MKWVSELIKSFLRWCQKWYCEHEQVYTKPTAHHKQNANCHMRVTCSFCGKRWTMLGKDIVATYHQEKECHCKYGKH